MNVEKDSSSENMTTKESLIKEIERLKKEKKAVLNLKTCLFAILIVIRL